MSHKRGVRISRIVAVVGIAVAAMPTVIAGSIAWSMVVVIAGLVIYYAGVSTVFALAQPDDDR